MTIVGINSTTNSKGTVSTIHVVDEFASYYNSPKDGRACTGQQASSIYVGNYDCSGLKVGSNIDIFYEKAVQTSKGVFQPIKKIMILDK